MLTLSNPSAIAFGLDLHRDRARLVRLHPAELLSTGLSEARSFTDLASFRAYWRGLREESGWPGPTVVVGVQHNTDDPYGILAWLRRQNVDLHSFDLTDYDRSFYQEFDPTGLTVHHRKAFNLAMIAAYRLNPHAVLQTLGWQLNRVRYCLDDLEHQANRIREALQLPHAALDEDWQLDDVPF